MRSPKTKGRMLNQGISDSKGFAALSPEAAVLFVMMIPHFDPYGKLNGDPGYIKGEVCPRIEYLPINRISSCLQEINDRTNVKWFSHDGRWWVHSTKFLIEHQKIDLNRCGSDLFPNYSGSTPELVENYTRPKSKSKSKKDTRASADADAPDSFPEEMTTAWNEEEAKHQGNGCRIPKILRLTPARRKKCYQRTASLKLNSKKWKEVVSKVFDNDFLSGKTPSKDHSGWRATFDWVIKNDDIILKIIEGAYDQ
jgi:hypothetical protein